MKNQCDGCMQGNEADDQGFHRDAKGMPYMMCTSSLYSEESKAAANAVLKATPEELAESYSEYESEMVHSLNNSENPKERLG